MYHLVALRAGSAAFTTIVAGRKFGLLCGFQNSTAFTWGFYTGRDDDLDVDIWWMSRAEIVAQALAETKALGRDSNEYEDESMQLAVA